MSTTHSEFRLDGDDLIVRVVGDLDVAAINHITAVAGLALDETAGEAKRLVIDMSCTTFLDSFGIGVLLDMKKTAAARGMPMVLRNAAPNIRRPLEVVELADEFGL